VSTAIPEQLSADIKAAMKGGEKERLAALRLISAAFKQHEVDQREAVDDDRAVDLLTRMAKQRRESITQYEAAAREDLASRERFELELISGYLPAQLSADEIGAAIDAAVAQTGAAGMRDMGKVMGVLNGDLKGRADMAMISTLVKARLSR